MHKKRNIEPKPKVKKIKSNKKPIRNSDLDVFLDKLKKKFNVVGTNSFRTQSEKENESGKSTPKTD